MESPVRELARRLGENAEAVCRHYLSNGRREGLYWMVGDKGNAPGRSLYLRLVDGDGRRTSGKWTDAATGERGDLLDIIAASCAHRNLAETLAEARGFLSLPQSDAGTQGPRPRRPRRAPTGSPDAAARLWTASKPIAGTSVRTYLAGRALRHFGDVPALRCHSHCYYRRSDEDGPSVKSAYPAMIAAVTDLDGSLMGVHRTWLDPHRSTKAPVAYPRRAMGHLLGHGVRFGISGEVMAFGEGIETMLSLREVAPALPLIAGLSAAHLAALEFPAPLRRLYVARERDDAGRAAFAALAERAAPLGIDILPLDPALDDLNSDLMQMGHSQLAASIAPQMHVVDAERMLDAA